MLSVNELTGIYLGVRGENLARTIHIDVSPWTTGHPTANISIWHKRAGASAKEVTGAAYNPETRVISWSPSGIDTYNEGQGIAEIRMTEDGRIKKSRDIPTMTSPSMIGENGETLESNWQAYMNDMDAKKQAAITARRRAEAWALGTQDGEPVDEDDEAYENSAKFWAMSAAGAKDAEITAERWAVGQRLGEDVPSTDATYHNNAKYYAQQARADREYVEGSAEAVTRAEAAAEAAEDAAATAQAAMSIVGTAFDSTKDYKAGDYCVHSGAMYRFTTDHPAGAWNAEHVTAENVSAALSGIDDGSAGRALHHLGFYLDKDGDLCQAEGE